MSQVFCIKKFFDSAILSDKKLIWFFQSEALVNLLFSFFIAVILVVVGILLAIILTIVAFTIWKFFRQRFHQDNEMDDENFSKTIAGRKSSFALPSLPVSTKGYNAQMPYQNEMVRASTEIPS